MNYGMSAVTEIVGYTPWVLIAVAVGFVAGALWLQSFDSKRRYEAERAEDAQREAVLAEGRANQARTDTIERAA